MGPWAGWMGGWGIIVADIIVMANLSQIAGIYTFSLVGITSPDPNAVLAVGVAWIVVMTFICYVGIESRPGSRSACCQPSWSSSRCSRS